MIYLLFVLLLLGVFMVVWALSEWRVQRLAEARFQAAIPKFPKEH